MVTWRSTSAKSQRFGAEQDGTRVLTHSMSWFIFCSTNLGKSHPTHISRQILTTNQHLFAAGVRFTRGRDNLYNGFHGKKP